MKHGALAGRPGVQRSRARDARSANPQSHDRFPGGSGLLPRPDTPGWELLGPNRFVPANESERAFVSRRIPYFAFEMINKALGGMAVYAS